MFIELVDMFDEKWFVDPDSITAIRDKEHDTFDVHVGHGLRLQMKGDPVDLIHKIVEYRKWGGR